MQTQSEWLAEFEGKTLRSIRPKHKGDEAIPSLQVTFDDDTEYEVFVRTGVFFEGAMINTLRKAQPITDVMVLVDGPDTYLEVSAGTFPLFILLAQNKKIPAGDFPFWLQKAGEDWPND